jgi:DNA polymerase V
MNVKNLGHLADVNRSTIKIPIFTEKVKVGWPSPADDYIERPIDLNEYLVNNSAATYLVRASGDSMVNAGINDGAILVVDRSLEAQHGKIVIASVSGAYACKRLQLYPKPLLLSENIKYPPIEIKEEEDLEIMGVVLAAINQF